MYNSAIISNVERFIAFLGNEYKESAFNKWFLRFDSILKKAALNSKITGVFIIKKGREIVEGSKAYGILAAIVRLSARYGKAIGAWIKGSKFIRTAEGMINQTFKNPFRILGIFAVSFLTANISFALILHRESRTLLIFKLILLIISLIAVRINSDFGKTLKDSRFYELFQWIIEVEK